MKAAAWLVLLCLGACSHDLDALREGRDEAGLRAGSGGSNGRGGSGGGASGRGAGTGAGTGAGGSTSDGGVEPDAGSGSGTGGNAGACEPCPELTTQAENLGLRACCRGATDLECGLTFGEGAVCLPRDVPGQPNDVCPEANPGSLTLPGCCRPDGRCGVVAEQVGLGCVARDEILPALGQPAPMPIACRFECEQDADCRGVPGGFVCVETPDRMSRFCADDCTRDRDCPRGLICALNNDLGMDRVLAICRLPLGSGEPGDACGSANDCVHGVCSRLMGQDPFCTELCSTVADCGAAAGRCVLSQIPTPSGEDAAGFKVCLP